MTTKCEIIFDRPEAIYKSGDFIKVNAELTTIKTKNVKGIYLELCGEAIAKWDESESDGDRGTNNTTFSGSEKLYTFVVDFKDVQTSNSYSLDAGVYRQISETTLPDLLPSTVTGIYGKIMYSAKVVLVRPGWKNQVFEKNFRIINTLDLNKCSPLIRLPVEETIAKKFCCFCCVTRPLQVIVNLERSGFIPGEEIVIRANVINRSRIDINSLQFALQKVILCESTWPRTAIKRQEVTLVSLNTNKIERKSEGTYERRLIVPHEIGVSQQGCCTVVSTNFDVKVTAECSGLHVSPYIEIPVTIGSDGLEKIRNN